MVGNYTTRGKCLARVPSGFEPRRLSGPTRSEACRGRYGTPRPSIPGSRQRGLARSKPRAKPRLATHTAYGATQKLQVPPALRRSLATASLFTSGRVA